ncbi:DsbA family oxidoreductase [Paenibacillus paridis]|uniref:DsbA family oxidoreductase n=1 Tax=Paenibacillus paridis TaxID=2583376 RepID=UPI00111CFFB3|nr:DsbA family oxidoreductase [Paenibacillus paridis]
MKVEIWSDYACPFCYIGKSKFELALERFAHKEKIETVFHSFELDPRADPHSGKSTYRMLADRYGMSMEKAKQATLSVTEQAAAAGLAFHFDKTVPTNTFDAHRVVHLAAKQGKDKQMAERLFKAYFTDGENIGDRDHLSSLAAEVGLDAAKVVEMLESSTFKESVREEEQRGSALGIQGVPFYLINGKYAVSGAQSPEVFLEMLTKAWDDKHPAIIQVNDEDADAICRDGSCTLDVPKS